MSVPAVKPYPDSPKLWTRLAWLAIAGACLSGCEAEPGHLCAANQRLTVAEVQYATAPPKSANEARRLAEELLVVAAAADFDARADLATLRVTRDRFLARHAALADAEQELRALRQRFPVAPCD